MASEDICGNCGAAIPTDSDICPNCRPKRKKIEALPVFLVLAVLGSSLLLLSSSVVNVVTLPASKPATTESAPAPPNDMTAAAYEAAKGYVEEQYPGPKRFSDLYQSTIEQKGDVYTVSLSADELAGETPVRYFFSVEMEYSGNTWKLRQLKR